MPKSKSFILNDENKVNSYGFRTLNAGIDLARFQDNPVLLDFHNPSNKTVIGRWANVRVEKNLLLADPEFDEEDEDAMKIKGKVDRGFLKGASMGLTFNHAYMELTADGTYLLTKSELLEGSIVSIPSNAHALKLYNETGDLLDDKSIQLSIETISKQLVTMNKVTLSVAALMVLGFQDNGIELTTLSAAIEKLGKDKEALQAKLTAEEAKSAELQSKFDKENETRALSLVDKAILEGRITADKKEHFLSMAKTNFDMASEVISSIPAKVSLAGKVVNKESGNTSEVKTMDDFQKLSHDEQVTFKADFPEEYSKLFNV